MPEGRAESPAVEYGWTNLAEPEWLKKSLAFSPDQKLTSYGFQINCNETGLVSWISSKHHLIVP